ncbi:LptE family protein [candidate division WOR-3 bacterium]|nr:LptE family protein [candidate division WOR-3 bacterium]
MILKMSKISAILLFSISGCVSYSFHGGTFPPKAQSISVPAAENISGMYGIEQAFTEAVRSAFIKDSRLLLTDSKDPDLTLYLKVSSYSNEVFSYTSDETIEQYQVSIAVSVTYINNIENDTIWKDKLIIANGIYSAYNQSEDDGKKSAYEDFSKILISLMTENW